MGVNAYISLSICNFCALLSLCLLYTVLFVLFIIILFLDIFLFLKDPKEVKNLSMNGGGEIWPEKQGGKSKSEYILLKSNLFTTKIS